MHVLFHLAVSAFVILLLCGAIVAKAQVGDAHHPRCGSVTVPALKALPEPFLSLPLETPHPTVLREEFYLINTGSNSCAEVNPADVMASISTNKPPVTNFTILGSISYRKNPDPLLDMQGAGPEPDALLAFSPNYEVVYFPALHTSFYKRSLTFDFNSVLDQTFGNENISPIIKRSSMALVKSTNDLLFEIKVPLSFGR
jgi:hypothetical protein